MNAAPLIEAEFTVTGDVPEEVSVNDCVAEEFTVTLPKLRVVALSVNFELAAAAPVPLNDTTAVVPLVEFTATKLSTTALTPLAGIKPRPAIGTSMVPLS